MKWPKTPFFYSQTPSQVQNNEKQRAYLAWYSNTKALNIPNILKKIMQVNNYDLWRPEIL